jgi:threonine synthase
MPDDGGLYVPSGLPRLPERVFDPAPLRYADLAMLVLQPFFADWEQSRLRQVLEAAYGSQATYFDTEEICPLTPLPGLSSELALAGSEGQEVYLLELFHGRTGAFKDLALSVLGGFLQESLKMVGEERIPLVLAATSGDTGSATLSGLANVPGILTAVFYPAEGTSEIQRLQMTTQAAKSSFVAGVRGDFDDAQRLVKRLFAQNAHQTRGAQVSEVSGTAMPASNEDAGLFPGVVLSSANSINVGRLLPQIVYYVKAWRGLAARGALGPDKLMHVAVPSGNFGDILAAKYAKEMGLPIGRLLCASNANKVLADFFATGVYDRRRELVKTDSPSMDILVSSNLERLLYLASGRDPDRTAELMNDLAQRGWFEISEKEKRYLADFSGGWCGDISARSCIAKVWSTDKVLIDPHTATAVEVLQRSAGSFAKSGPVVVAATASPFKFPEVCLESLGVEASARGSLASARRLSTITGVPLPAFISELESKSIIHNKIIDLDEAVTALSEFVAAALSGARKSS